MKIGHRRTSSQNCISTLPREFTYFKLHLKQKNTQISKFIRKSNCLVEPRTVYIETLDLPRSRSSHDMIFCFGRSDHKSQTCVSTQHDEEKKLIRCTSGKKYVEQQTRKSLKKGNVYVSQQKSCKKNKCSLNISKLSNTSKVKQPIQKSKPVTVQASKTKQTDGKFNKSKLIKSRLKK